ncbi:winged helix-turn-helix domain-containing protein [Kitasatospora sp. NPDC028055]|uniref:ArsR/SmtB family transcription factor n=1 Tax=Kitasatospora sp. NPDC028055 TaxID=3155653 RepID=UPI0033CADE0C
MKAPGGHVIRIELSADAVARTRFAISPLYQAMNLLFALGRHPQAVPLAWRRQAREVIAERRLWLLSALAISPHGYTPDFLTPEPSAYRCAVDTELHLVATTAAARVRGEMSVLLTGLAASEIPARTPHHLVLHALEQGEGPFADRLAVELHEFWTKVFQPRWPRVSARLERDIDRRAALTVRQGFAGMADSLHRRLSWDGGALVAGRAEPGGLRLSPPGLVLVPGTFPPGLMLSLDSTDSDAAAGRTRRNPALVYPAAADNPLDDQRLRSLLGTSRTALLTHLSQARTTTELADRTGLSPSTVSYHLQALHRGGLVRRTRRSRHVYYQAVGDPRELLS